jgi:peptidoglycan hydrolase CwlO-like protein
MAELKGDINNAPLASSLFSKGSTPFGHTWIKKRPFPNNTGAGWSTDLWKTGLVGPVANTAPHTVWGHELLGAGLSVNGYALDLTGKQPPKPKQNKRYQRIERAHNNLGTSVDALVHARDNLRRSLATAEKQHDAADIKSLKHHLSILNEDIADTRKEMERLEELYKKARHS